MSGYVLGHFDAETLAARMIHEATENGSVLIGRSEIEARAPRGDP
jgi:hypothetical protein